MFQEGYCIFKGRRVQQEGVQYNLYSQNQEFDTTEDSPNSGTSSRSWRNWTPHCALLHVCAVIQGPETSKAKIHLTKHTGDWRLELGVHLLRSLSRLPLLEAACRSMRKA